MNLGAKRIQKQMEKVQKEEEDDPTGQNSPSEKQEKIFIFKGLKTKTKEGPSSDKNHIYRALPVIGIRSRCRPSLNLLLPNHTVIEFSKEFKRLINILYEKVALRKEDYTLTTFNYKSGL